MSGKVAIQKTTLEAIGEAVRDKEGSTDLIPVNTLADRITALPSEKNKLIPFINGDETMELTETDLADLTNPIKDYAFYKTKLKSVELPPHITALGKYCFASSRIDTIKTYATSLGECCFSNAFTEEHSLDLYLLANEFSELGKSAFKGSGIRYYPAQFNLHFNDSKAYYNFVRALLQSDDSVMSSTPPKAIYFQDTSVKQLEVPSDITNINKQIFRNCKFTKIKFLGDVTYLTGWAFYGLPLYELDLTACTTVPTLLNPTGFDSGYGDIKTYFKVPSALYDEWISATNWSTLANYIVAV